MLASGSTDKDAKVQKAIILNCAGPHVIKLAKQFSYEDGEDKDDPDLSLKKIEEYCNPRQNEVMQTFRFWKAEAHEPFDAFLSELREKAASCNFKDPDRMLRDKNYFFS